MPKMSEYVKTFKVKDRDKDKKNNLMSFRINDDKLLEKYQAIQTKIENLKYIQLNALPEYDDRYIKTKEIMQSDKLYTNFHGLHVPEKKNNVNILQSSLLIFTFLRKQILSASIVTELSLQSCKKANGRLS